MSSQNVVQRGCGDALTKKPHWLHAMFFPIPFTFVVGLLVSLTYEWTGNPWFLVGAPVTHVGFLVAAFIVRARTRLQISLGEEPDTKERCVAVTVRSFGRTIYRGELGGVEDLRHQSGLGWLDTVVVHWLTVYCSGCSEVRLLPDWLHAFFQLSEGEAKRVVAAWRQLDSRGGGNPATKQR